MKTEHVFTAKNIDVFVVRQPNLVYSRWRGNQPLHLAQEGCYQILKAIHESGIERLLNDDRLVTGDWMEAGHWTAQVFNPMLYSLHPSLIVAWILSPDKLSAMSAENVSHSFPKIEAKLTNDIHDGVNWLFEGLDTTGLDPSFFESPISERA